MDAERYRHWTYDVTTGRVRNAGRAQPEYGVHLVPRPQPGLRPSRARWLARVKGKTENDCSTAVQAANVPSAGSSQLHGVRSKTSWVECELYRGGGSPRRVVYLARTSPKFMTTFIKAAAP